LIVTSGNVFTLLDLLADWIGRESWSGAQERNTRGGWLLTVTNSLAKAWVGTAWVKDLALLGVFVGLFRAYRLSLAL
jgi:hypothetical protein